MQTSFKPCVQYREHDGERYRVWTHEDARYGAFKVLARRELQIVIRACTLLGGTCIPAMDAECDPIDMSDFK